MRVLVCGGRNFSDRERLFRTLDDMHAETPIDVIIHGGCSGADALAGEWAKLRGVCEQVFYANWRKYGRSAGPRRNGFMLSTGKPDKVLACPGGKGTWDMLSKADAAGVPTIILL